MTASHLAVCSLLCLTLAGCGEDEPPAAAGPTGGGGFVFPVTFVEAAVGEVLEGVNVVGDVGSRQRAHLAFERSGRLIEVLAETGDTVAAGAVLARMDESVLRAELQAAEAALAAVRTDAQYAQDESQRAQDLGEALADSERDRLKTLASVRATQVLQREAELLRLQTLLEQSELRAPFDGIITQHAVTTGSYILNGVQAFELLDLRNLELRLEIPASVAGQVKEKDLVVVELPGDAPPAEISLPLHAILPAADARTRTFRGIVRLDAAAAPGLRPGMFVRARLPLRASSGLKVPVDALLENPQGAVVVVADPGAAAGPPTARFVPVRVLARAGGMAAVESLEPGALAVGAQVVVTGCDNVFPGAPLLLQAHRAAL